MEVSQKTAVIAFGRESIQESLMVMSENEVEEFEAFGAYLQERLMQLRADLRATQSEPPNVQDEVADGADGTDEVGPPPE